MSAVTDADREAAEELRILLADKSGFWHLAGDAGPICRALAQHRELAERRVRQELAQASPGYDGLMASAEQTAVTPLSKARDARVRSAIAPALTAPALPKAVAL